MESILAKLLEENKQLKSEIFELSGEIAGLKSERPYSSSEIKDLVGALAKARLDFKSPAKNKIVQFSGRKYEYSDLAAITEAVAPALAKHGIALVQQVEDQNGATILHTRLLHSSGQWIESRSRVIPVGKTQQEWGSAMSYQRRYNIMSLCAIAPDDEPSDDDALTADKKDINKFEQGIVQSKINPRKDSYVTITPEQLDFIESELSEPVFADDLEKVLTDILEAYHIGVLADLPKNRFDEVMKRVLTMKQTRLNLNKKP